MNKLVLETCQEVKEMCQEIKKMCQGVKDICLEVRECGTSYRKWLQCYGNVPVVGAKLSIFPDNPGDVSQGNFFRQEGILSYPFYQRFRNR